MGLEAELQRFVPAYAVFLKELAKAVRPLLVLEHRIGTEREVREEFVAAKMSEDVKGFDAIIQWLEKDKQAALAKLAEKEGYFATKFNELPFPESASVRRHDRTAYLHQFLVAGLDFGHFAYLLSYNNPQLNLEAGFVAALLQVPMPGSLLFYTGRFLFQKPVSVEWTKEENPQRFMSAFGPAYSRTDFGFMERETSRIRPAAQFWSAAAFPNRRMTSKVEVMLTPPHFSPPYAVAQARFEHKHLGTGEIDAFLNHLGVSILK